ncbi:uncharacterized protein [Arachis hypogaea]|uniref:uncharacterized protein n=1 Tax=Arachis hypogaea TaxID=3818 RepID=UPI003B219CDC
MLALTEFDLQYVPAKAVKGQVITDFLVEYETLILGLEILISNGDLEVQIFGDSQLVLKQLSKEFKCNNEKLQTYLTTAWELLTSFRKVSLVQIPRVHNEIANEREVLCIDEWKDTDWRKPIAQYLKNSNIPVGRKMKLQAINFVLMADELYKKGIDESLSRYLGQEDQNIALGEVRNGICGAHQAEKR